MKYRDLLKMIEADGWYWQRTNGSHRIYQHPVKPGSFPVPVHSLGKDVPPGLKQAILKTSGVEIMAKYTAILKQAEDGSWSAYTLTPTVAIGVGDTKESALEDLKSGMSLWLDHMKATGEAVQAPNMEVVSIEVAA